MTKRKKIRIGAKNNEIENRKIIEKINELKFGFLKRLIQLTRLTRERERRFKLLESETKEKKLLPILEKKKELLKNNIIIYQQINDVFIF